MYDLGDRVRIITSGKTGSICDARMVDGRPLYIVDCSGECDSDALKDCVVTVEENEIEAVQENPHLLILSEKRGIMNNTSSRIG